MYAIASLLVIVILSLLVIRIATVALTLTGLSEQLARFQARSAFTGAGFTTSESEKVMKHPVRRRIIMLLLLLGNAGFISAISSLILTFVRNDGEAGITQSLWFRLTVLALGLAGLWTLAYSTWIDTRLSRAIEWALKRWTRLEVRDYASLLRLSGDYAVSELQISEGDWIEERPLSELRLNDEGVLALGVERPDGSYIGAPKGNYRMEPGDVVLLYGPREGIAELGLRRAGAEGNRQHDEASKRQDRVEEEQNRKIEQSQQENPPDEAASQPPG